MSEGLVSSREALEKMSDLELQTIMNNAGYNVFLTEHMIALLGFSLIAALGVESAKEHVYLILDQVCEQHTGGHLTKEALDTYKLKKREEFKELIDLNVTASRNIRGEGVPH